MSRRYVRDSRGRFASTGSGRIYSAAAADTRTAGMIQRGNHQATFRAQRASSRRTDSPKAAAGQIARAYRGDMTGLRQDLRNTRRQGMKNMLDAARDVRTQGGIHPVDRALQKYKAGQLSKARLRRIVARHTLRSRSTDALR